MTGAPEGGGRARGGLATVDVLTWCPPLAFQGYRCDNWVAGVTSLLKRLCLEDRSWPLEANAQPTVGPRPKVHDKMDK